MHNPYVLEVGGGIDVVRWALMGYEVDACDVSAKGNERTVRSADKHGVADHIRIVRAPAQDLELEAGRYGMALCNGVLDYVEKDEDKRRIIAAMKEAVAPEGIIALSAWADFPNPPVACHNEVKMFPDLGGEISTAAFENTPDWRLRVAYLELDRPDHSHAECEDQPHSHGHIKIIAQKAGELTLAGSA